MHSANLVFMEKSEKNKLEKNIKQMLKQPKDITTMCKKVPWSDENKLDLVGLNATCGAKTNSVHEKRTHYPYHETWGWQHNAARMLLFCFFH